MERGLDVDLQDDSDATGKSDACAEMIRKLDSWIAVSTQHQGEIQRDFEVSIVMLKILIQNAPLFFWRTCLLPNIQFHSNNY